jgi:light-regulated signal transduction histidine kinase (bacteriophytochrome)
MSKDIRAASATQSQRVIDLTECEREPICHLGLIQPHGCLLALNSRAEITHASENTGRYFELPADAVLGRSLSFVAGSKADGFLRDGFPSLEPGHTYEDFWQGTGEQQYFWAHQNASQYILEWENLPNAFERAAPDAVESNLAKAVKEIQSSPHIHRQAELAAEHVAGLTGYDRVMIYQFQPDWSGEVIAEVRDKWAEPYLGLRYPASDIPPQARKLYTETLLRSVVDVAAVAVNVLSLPDAAALNLTHSKLRAMSPYHIEYLKNMRVGATTTASLMCKGMLWGMIACHHNGRKSISRQQRRAVSEIARTLSAGIESAKERAQQSSYQRILAREQALEQTVPDCSKALAAILFGPDRLRKLLHADGTAVWSEQRSVRMGDTPLPQELEVLAACLLSGNEDIVAMNSRAEIIARFGIAFQKTALAGLIGLIISRQPALVLFGFRNESLREIIWGGDINEPVLRHDLTGALSARRSFAHYKQSVAGQAAAWSVEDLATAKAVLATLRARAPAVEEEKQLIECGFEAVRALATGNFALQDSLLDAIGSGISLLFRSGSGDSALRYANQTLLDLAGTGLEPDTHFADVAELLGAIGLPLDLISLCESTPYQVVLPTARGGMRHFLVETKLALALVDKLGSVSLTALQFTDTTRMERAREALQASQERAQHLAFLKSSFLSNMSHEIRTPMNGILGMVQLLQTTKPTAKQQQYLDVIQHSGEMLTTLINDILDLAKIEAGRVELETAPFELSALVEGVVDLLKSRGWEKGISLSAVFDAEPPLWFVGDSHRLRQVILNLTGNAIKFTAKGQVVIRIHSADNLAVIAVSDTGIGIRQEQLAQVFDKFHQADQSTTRQYGGTGMGLAISRELIGLMGGTIAVASTLGMGSTFTVSIPLPSINPPPGTPNRR